MTGGLSSRGITSGLAFSGGTVTRTFAPLADADLVALESELALGEADGVGLDDVCAATEAQPRRIKDVTRTRLRNSERCARIRIYGLDVRARG